MQPKKQNKLICVGRWVVAGVMMLAGAGIVQPRIVKAKGCPDLRVVFARGSGGERWNDKNYLEFKSTIEEKLKTVNLKYAFIDLDYPAVGVGLDNLDVAIGALFGAGEAYEFGESVNTGVNNLSTMINGGACPETKYVIGGYSQGAMVVSKALNRLNPNRVIYAATFGDPKIYLPEGAGIIPAACKGENLSDYRMYVPDCQAYKGLLGAYIPYEPENYTSKLGTWCNKMDIFCSSHFNIEGLLSEAEIDRARLATEIAIFADRANIDEELVRLASHFTAMRELFEGDEPVGRKLDFLVQEMNREFNTIGSKANDKTIAALVIDGKAEIEKLREQVQNLE